MTQSTMLALALCLLVLAGLGSLALASARYRQQFNVLPPPARGIWRVSGWLLLALVSATAIVLQGWAMALVYLFAAVSLATTSLAMMISYRPGWMLPMVCVSLPIGLLLLAGL